MNAACAPAALGHPASSGGSGAVTPLAADPRPRSYLAFDYGTRRIGVATGNSLLAQARPLCSVTGEGRARFEQIGRLVAEWQPDALVVGIPVHPDGQPHDITGRARRFARQLQGRYRLPVHEVDERYSSTEAISRGAADHDAEAAAIILEQFLRSEPG